MIITSLNLFEFSMANNKEMGVLIDKSETSDKVLFEDAYKEVDYINQTSQRFEFGAGKPPSSKKSDTPLGYCIRTGAEIPFNIKKPLSDEAYKIWNQFSDKDYPEKFCHFSGAASNGETTFNRPILKKNWKKAQEVHGI
jgi:hypothetical protein